MRKLSIVCFVAALLLIAMRLCTGIVYGEDAPVDFLVVKAPSWTFVRHADEKNPHPQHLVLDTEEPELFYEKPYTLLMKSAPVSFIALLIVGVGLQASAGRRVRQKLV